MRGTISSLLLTLFLTCHKIVNIAAFAPSKNFATASKRTRGAHSFLKLSATNKQDHASDGEEGFRQNKQRVNSIITGSNTRRSIITKTLASVLAGSAGGLLVPPGQQPAYASVGSLPEYADTNAIVQGVTVSVADLSQQNSMIAFLQDGFNFRLLRQKQTGSVTDTWLGFGPEQLSIPSDFVIPVSSFSMYGGHSSIRIRYDAKSTAAFYKTGGPAPGDNIAFLQVAVPEYRISQMVKNGGNIIDAYGFVNVVSPCGLPMRGIVGISPDPIMFLAINCQDVQQSRAFYERLGFIEQEYPYARPSKGKGQFEPAQPPKSVYLAPSRNCMGVLLLQNKNKKAKVTPNPVLQSMNIVYTPASEGGDAGATTSNTSDEQMFLADPSGVPISFVSVENFETEERSTRVGPTPDQ